MAEPTATPTGTQYNYYTHRDPLLHPPSPRCYTHRDPIATSIGNPLSHTQGIHHLTRRESTVTHTHSNPLLHPTHRVPLIHPQRPTATPTDPLLHLLSPHCYTQRDLSGHCYTHRDPLLHTGNPLLHPQGPTATHRKSTATPTGTHCYTQEIHCYTHRDPLLHP